MAIAIAFMCGAIFGATLFYSAFRHGVNVTLELVDKRNPYEKIDDIDVASETT